MLINQTKVKLSESCKIIDLCGIRILGCADTGAIIGLDDEGEAFISILQDEGFINETNLTENQLNLLNAMHHHGYFKESKPVQKINKAYLHVTSNCNLKCDGCYSHEEDRNSKQHLSLFQIRNILNKLKKSGISMLIISGGEPFIREDMVDILKYAKLELEIEHINCITNGTASIETYMDASIYCDTLSFSLDSHDNKSAVMRPNYIFDSLVKKVQALKESGACVEIIFTMHRKNLTTSSCMADLAESIGVPYSYSLFSTVEFESYKSDLALTNEDYEMLFETENNNINNLNIDDLRCTVACSAGRTMISVASNGDIYPCHLFNGYSEFLMGNILQNDVAEILQGNANILASTTVDDLTACSDCAVRYLCGGGCRFRGYALSGNILQADTRLCKNHFSKIETTINQALSQ